MRPVDRDYKYYQVKQPTRIDMLYVGIFLALVFSLAFTFMITTLLERTDYSNPAFAQGVVK